MTWNKITNSIMSQRLTDEEMKQMGINPVFSIRTQKKIGYEGFRGLTFRSLNDDAKFFKNKSPDSWPEFVLCSDRPFSDTSSSAWLSIHATSKCPNASSSYGEHRECKPNDCKLATQHLKGMTKKELSDFLKDSSIPQSEKYKIVEPLHKFWRECHGGTEEFLNESCNCGIYSHLDLPSSLAYNEGNGLRVPVRLTLSGSIWKGLQGYRAHGATLTGIILPSSLSKDAETSRFRVGTSVSDDQIAKLQKFYKVPILDYSQREKWPTSAQVLHQLQTSI